MSEPFLPPTTPSNLLLTRLSEVGENLAVLYEQLAFTRRTEHDLKIQAYQASDSETIAGRNRDAEIACAHATTSVWELEANIEALKEEKFYLHKCLEWQRAAR